jgi:hypothetical protein
MGHQKVLMSLDLLYKYAVRRKNLLVRGFHWTRFLFKLTKREYFTRSVMNWGIARLVNQKTLKSLEEVSWLLLLLAKTMRKWLIHQLLCSAARNKELRILKILRWRFLEPLSDN